MEPVAVSVVSADFSQFVSTFLHGSKMEAEEGEIVFSRHHPDGSITAHGLSIHHMV